MTSHLRTQAAVVNMDDAFAPLVLQRVGPMPVVTYSYSNKEADVFVDSAKYSIWESEVIISTPEGKLQIITPLLGKRNVCSVLAAVATGVALKVRCRAVWQLLAAAGSGCSRGGQGGGGSV